jgi:hypothetical protein
VDDIIPGTMVDFAVVKGFVNNLFLLNVFVLNSYNQKENLENLVSLVYTNYIQTEKYFIGEFRKNVNCSGPVDELGNEQPSLFICFVLLQ